MKTLPRIDLLEKATAEELAAGVQMFLDSLPKEQLHRTEFHNILETQLQEIDKQLKAGDLKRAKKLLHLFSVRMLQM